MKPENNRSRYHYKIASAKPRSILIKNAPYLISANERDEVDVTADASVYIENGEILAVYARGKKHGIVKETPDLIYDAGARGGVVLTPGFVNSHAHPTMYLMRSAMLLDYGQHLDETIAKMPLWQKHITGSALATSILGDLTEEQRGGITTTVNHNAVFNEVDEAAELTGQRIINCVSAVSNTNPKSSLDTALAYFRAEKRRLSKGGIALHYLFKVDEELLRRIKSSQAEDGILLTIHFAESQGVAEHCVRKFGVRETKLLEKYGLLNELTLLSHVLHVTNKEIEVLVNARVGIVHLPTSNSIHKSGVFDYPTFAAFGGAPYIALGTDSVVSKSRLDLLTEAFQTRMTHLPEYTVYYEELFKMMTVNGARILQEPTLGRIAPGFSADIAFWKLKDRGFLPFDANDPKTLIGNIISHGGRSARDLMIDGRFVISDRRHNFINESALLEDIQKAHMEVRARVELEKVGYE